MAGFTSDASWPKDLSRLIKANHEPNGRLRCAANAASKRLTAHQARLRGCRRDALAHDGTAKRTEALHQEEAQAARPLHGQEIRQQAAIEKIDRKATAGHVRSPRAVIAVREV